MKMRYEVYERNCKNCPMLSDCLDWGISCRKVIDEAKETEREQ